MTRAQPDTQSSGRADGGQGESTAEAAARGARWTVAAMIARQFGRLGFALVLARLLGPTQFAVAGAATIYIAITAVLLDTGLATGIVQKPVLRRADEGATFWTMTGVALVLSGLTIALSDAISRFLTIPELRPVLMVLALGPLLKGFTVVSAARLQRDLRFRALGLGEIVATLAGAGAGVAAAVSGAGHWALVVQQVCTDLLVLVIWVSAAGLPAFTADREAFRHVRTFGVPMMVSQTLGYTTRSADNVIISHFLGQAALSFYMIPYRIMLVPVSLLGNVANRVAFPIIARLQEDPWRVRRIHLKITQTIAVVVIPGMLSAAVLAPELIATVFGPEWLPAVPVLIALALTGILDSLTTTGGAVFMGMGRADLAFRWSWIPMLIYLPSFFAGLPWGVVGVAAAYSIAVALVTPFQVRAIGGVAAFGLGDWLRAIRPMAAAAVPAAALGWLAAYGLRQVGVPVPMVLVLALALIAAAYLVLLRVVDAGLFRESVQTARLLARGRLSAVTEAS